jgi:hypothetical protein
MEWLIGAWNRSMDKLFLVVVGIFGIFGMG